MCDICLQTPCHSQCPNAKEPEWVFKCKVCGRKIYDGDEYYEILDHPICIQCVEESLSTAEGGYYLDE